ncbi:hypothetical protein [Ramlibacter albus]|uniref:Uncharacterized protein n=1 Tax=Ramlibacter albus TaxID=2079448 RepID=A0A923S385_9BURK|nr:hypothetical protein [Ramlibacter albus]MBC5765578.1 hypothetical protein [Ramlibacter albus]
MKARLRSTVAAAMVLLPAAATFVATPNVAVAAPRYAAPEIITMQVNSDEGLSRGADLSFALEGTPRSKVSVTFSRITLTLKETSAGMYRGTYTVRAKDRIDPTQPIVARLTSGRSTATSNFTWPSSFQALSMGNAPTPVAALPRVENFRMWPRERLEPGRELHYIFTAPPGLSATFEIPGVATAIPMREVAPGRYEGTYTIRQRDNIAAFDTAVATVRSGTQTVTARLSANTAPRDNQPPQVVGMTPRPGDVISLSGPERVSAQFDDNGGRGVDPATVRLTISGRDVTSESRITPNEVTFRGDLPPGRHTAEVTARDFAGNAVSKSWNFEVAGRDRVGAVPGGPLTLAVTSPAHNAQVDANGNLVIQGRTAPFARVTARVEAVAPVFGNRLSVAQPVMTETVQADREGFFTLSTRPSALPIPGTRFEVSLTATHNAQTAEQRLTVYQRQG